MELRLLRTFLTVAEVRHFARAAVLCNLSQPAVSHQIALLEEELGIRLLNRSARRVSLTVAGEVLLEEARRVLGAVDRARERMQEVARGAVGRIRIGATPTPGLFVLPPLLAQYRGAHPAYDLRFEIGAAHTLAAAVAANELDMAIVAGVLPAGDLRARTLGRDEFVAIAPAGSPLATGPKVKAGRLADEPWILREEGSDTRRQVAAWWHRHRLHPPRTCTFTGPHAVTRAVSAGLGVTMASRLSVADELANGRVALVRLAAPLPARDLVLIDHPQKHHGAACRAMLALMERTFAPVTRAGRPPAARATRGGPARGRRRG